MSRIGSLLRRMGDPGETVLERAVVGGAWVAGLTAADRAVRLGMFVVLAGLLSPAAFGVLGLAVLALSVLRRSTRLGFDEALVKRSAADVDPLLDTVWLIRIARGLVLAGAAIAVAPLLASFLETPALSWVVRALAVVPLVTGLRNPGVVYFQKDLAFHRQFAYGASGTLAQAAVAIGGALLFGDVRALVLGFVAGAAVQTVVSYGIHPYRPRPAFDATAARELFGYGKWIFGSGLVLLCLDRGDDGVVGWLLGASALGLYQMAFRFSNAPATEVTHVISRVAFPALSRVQDDESRLREGFFGTLRLVSYLSFPMAVGIALVAPVFIRAFFGPEWIPMVDAMVVLAIWGAFRALGAVVGPLFRAVGHPEYSTVLQLSRLLVLVILIYPATARWGIAGAAAAVLASGLIQHPIALSVAARTVGASPRRVLRTLAYPAAASLAMGAAVGLTQRAISTLQPWRAFVLLVGVGVGAYAMMLFVGDRLWAIRLRRDLLEIRDALA